ncbi:MAG TPA: 3'-5' exonuclease [Actinobacteria bacterium]|nr:3'-5' exonuclease [Actinomycetota bacterium]
MTWHDHPLAVLDLEATGVDPDTARIVEVGLFRVDPDGATEPVVHRLVDPGVPLPAVVTELTGITPADLAAEGAEPAGVLAATCEALHGFAADGTPIVVYNATYDWPLLGNELVRHGLPPLPDLPPAILIDPLVLDRYVDRYRRGKRTLASVAAHYGVSLGGAHRVAADAQATVTLARRLAEHYPELQIDGPELVALQRQAHETWKTSFNDYLARIRADRPPVTETWPTG